MFWKGIGNSNQMLMLLVHLKKQEIPSMKLLKNAERWTQIQLIEKDKSQQTLITNLESI